MVNIWTIFKRELRNYFNSPIAYIFIMLLLGFTGFVFFFFFHFFAADDASMRYYFAAMPWFFIFFAAAIAMRLWSEERKVGTMELLLTMPLRSHEIVLGKYLAGLTILIVTLGLTITVPITVGIAGDPDWGKIITGYVGAFLAGALLLALGAFVSATTENQIVALLVTVVAGILLMAIGIETVVAEINDFVGLRLGDQLAYFSPLTHFDNMERGVLDLRDAVYFLSMTALALLLNHFAVENRKY
jgi:ABC-2 type transport system permease protein